MTAPTLLSLTLTDTVDATSSPLLQIKVEASDSDGVAGAMITWEKALDYRSPSGDPALAGHVLVNTSDLWTSGSRTEVIEVKKLNQPGEHRIRSLSISDTLGNSTSYSGAELAQLGFDTTFMLTGAGLDYGAPELTSLNIPSTINTAKGPVLWTPSAGATDALSDVSHVSVELARPMKIALGVLPGRPAASEYFDSILILLLDRTGEFPADTVTTKVWVDAANGVYDINRVRLTDTAGNSRYYDTGQLHELGMTTQVVVSDGSFVAPQVSSSLRIEPAGSPGAEKDGMMVLKVASNAFKAGTNSVKFTVHYDTVQANFETWSGGGKGSFAGTVKLMAQGTRGQATMTATIEAGAADSHIELHFKPLVAKGVFAYDVTGISINGDTAINSVDQQLPYRIHTLRDGSPGADRLYGDWHDDLFQAGAGDDIMVGDGGMDELRGGAGTDAALYGNARALYKVERSGAELVVSNLRAAGDVDRLNSVEILQFADLTMNFDASGDAAAVYRLYKAAFDRVPDAAGFGFWVHARAAGVSLQDIAAGFVASSEFTQLYGASATNASIVKGFYQNVLDRQPDAGGTAFWEGVLDRKSAAVADVLIGFADSAENQAGVASLIGQGMSYIPYG